MNTTATLRRVIKDLAGINTKGAKQGLREAKELLKKITKTPKK